MLALTPGATSLYTTSGPYASPYAAWNVARNRPFNCSAYSSFCRNFPASDRIHSSE